jgi:hypothetical protein
MTSDEIKSLLEQVFFEDEYEVSEKEYEKYKERFKIFYLKVYSEKLNTHIPMITIKNYTIGTTIVNDVWQMIWSLPDQNYYMSIPGTSTKRNSKDVGDTKSFLMISKERLKDILLINKLNSNLMSNMKNMNEDSMNAIRDFKINNLCDI